MAASLFISSAYAGEFHGMGDVPGGGVQSQALGVTADGKTVVGMSSSVNGIEAVRWTVNDGIEVIGDLPGGGYIARALGISGDGSFIVGRATSSNGIEAFNWRQQSGMTGMGDLAGGLFRSVSTRVSNNGSVVVGVAGTASGAEAMRWTAIDGMQGLGDLPGGLYDSWARGVSSDGHVIVGWGHSKKGKEAFRWTKADGMQALGDLPGGVHESVAHGVSDDGNVIVGYGKNISDTVAVRWLGNTIEPLDNGSSGLTNTRASVVSSNGAVIVGTSNSGVFVWDKDNGMRLLKDILLNEYGINLGNWNLFAVEDISPDGTTIVGYGLNKSGRMEGYIAKIDPVNTPPVANAGVDQTVLPDTAVTLDGSNSTDPDGDFMLKYHWTISYKPQGSAAVLSNPDIVNPVLVTDKVGDYVIDLVVSDSFNADSTVDSVIISTVNSQPVANAGDDQSVILGGSAIELNGSGSQDPDGDAITYKWRFTKKPIESKTEINDDSVVNPVFIADAHGTYELELVVTDSFGFVSDPDVVVVSFNNLVPVAQAGKDQNVFTGTPVTLSGNKSSDQNQDELTYRWVLVSAPETSTVTISNINSINAEFVPDIEGTYVIGLVVNDGLIDSEMDNMMITATKINSAIMGSVDEMLETVKGMEPSLFFRHIPQYRHDVKYAKGSKKYKRWTRYQNKRHQRYLQRAKYVGEIRKKILVRKLMSVKRKIAKDRFNAAERKLTRNVMKRFDGCKVTGNVDRNDWVRDCSAQQTIYPIAELTRDLLKLLVK